MFADHQPIVGQWARDDADNLAEVLAFVVHTIQTPLKRAVADHLAGELGNLPGERRAAIDNVNACKRAIFEDVCEVSHNPDALLGLFAGLPGIGFAKAGFVCQLVYGVSGCLDTHNLRRFGISPWRFAHAKRGTPARRDRRAREYNATVDLLGGTETLWNSWCHYVAATSRAKYDDAEQVSRLHAEAFQLV